jgi:hypothetical protein
MSVLACSTASPDSSTAETTAGGVLVEIGPEGWTPTQQPPEFSPFLRSLSQGPYFYLGEGRER